MLWRSIIGINILNLMCLCCKNLQFLIISFIVLIDFYSAMVFHLPNEQSLRLHINYTQQFTFTLLWNIGIAGMIVTGLFLIFFIFKKYQLRLAANQALRQSMITQDQRTSQHRISHRVENGQEEGLIVELKPTPKTKLFKFVNLLTSLWFYLFWVIASLVYLTFFMFGYFGRGNHVDVLAVFVLNGALILPTLLWKHKTKTVSWGKLKKEAIFTIVMLIIWMGISIFLVVATKGACVCYFQDQYGFSVSKDAKLSTEFTRSGAIGAPCLENEVCRLYATVPQDATTGVFFNVHAGTKIESLTFDLKLNSATIASKTMAIPSFKVDNIETLGQRNVFSALFTNLTPDTLYQIVVSDNTGKALKWANYKTVPGYDAQQIKMAVGGDLGMTAQGKKMTSYLINFKPDVIILGGDTVYDDAMRSCFFSWDEFYSMFDTVNTKLDRIVPLILTVGNHDIGFDALTDNYMRTSQDEYPLFFVYNPQHKSETNDVPSYDKRRSYHYHIVGPTMHFNLDSGYINPFHIQTQFMNNTILGFTKPYYYFANYHNPIYPACTNTNEGSNDRLVIEAGERLWTPVFDAFGFIASMQHHTHYRKFTYPIRNREVNMTKGTRYIGDGSWGVTQDSCPAEKHTPHPNFMEKVAFQEANHMWQVTVKLTDPATRTHSINYTAIDLQGAVVIHTVDNLAGLSS